MRIHRASIPAAVNGRAAGVPGTPRTQTDPGISVTMRQREAMRLGALFSYKFMQIVQFMSFGEGGIAP
jgi:hypothetical protein